MFFVSDSMRKLIPDECYKISSTVFEMKKLKTMMIQLKGAQLLNLSRNLKSDIEMLQKIKNDPGLIYELSLKQVNTDIRTFM